ncbi:DNA-directed RNA polymerase III subunit RPC10 [Prunus yedoensis var. nudiflora]|uniref:DNA-directed RNA polymerase subunit n=6 Tax=Prunus TaxID=3754 RepID=A0A251QLH6_PRUPE|nr:PREDICTED: DNA-directed RNA polymerase III subunit RPC10 [Prunus mume]XP_008233104.1 PREDICTED: DNA-directed RNA polymerase III subunit RPC10 [Prunus mume]XP_008233105.1 PREDICTED: DNA-directed RNA polymerase III subunit RPC10 [Prunus mume]XP_008233106.1 PREDICTED: DNA-directed RNA polymerase III subunit RPC10 [Prunus mume]XP_020414071.1 DNA-directed RNA polymerase III subunit RPC10-like [Prunus persica]XP_020414072.1 DNA-directed RNA polymerase III subunit RPC10-like [Prunus persica]XP_02
MEFCPSCANMLQYELPNMHDARFFCPTCPYVAYVDRKVKIKRRQHLVKKEIQPIFTLDDYKNAPKIEEPCPRCGFPEAAYRTQQTRSADEAETRFFRCMNNNCGHTWVDYS